MVIQITFDVDGVPVAKGRPRFTRTGHAYTPSKTVVSEQIVLQSFLNASKNVKFDLQAPICIDVVYLFKFPKNTSQRQINALKGKTKIHTKRPDGDNLVKLVQDALNGTAWNDDSQVFHTRSTKLYGTENRTIAVITYMDSDIVEGSIWTTLQNIYLNLQKLLENTQ